MTKELSGEPDLWCFAYIAFCLEQQEYDLGPYTGCFVDGQTK